MGRGQNMNININLEEHDCSSHRWLWGGQEFSGKVIADVVKIAQKLELEVELEDVTELLQSHDKILMEEELLPIYEQREWFLKMESTMDEDVMKIAEMQQRIEKIT